MLNKERHQLIMGRILKDVYTDISISSEVGFKGGTCAYFFYALPRFSVDLDFDLLDTTDAAKKIIFVKITSILKKYGVVKNKFIKRNTIFFLLSYGDVDHNIKIEINTRQLTLSLRERYEIKEYLGISVLAARQDYMFASKLAALTSRSKIAARDVYDIYYFAKNNWDIDRDVLQARTGRDLKGYLAECITVIEKIKDNQILQGLGELLNAKEKLWVKNHLREEVAFMLKNYGRTMK